MITKALRLIIGVLLIPVSIGFAGSFSEQLLQIQQVRVSEMAFLLGITAYLAFHAVVAVPRVATQLPIPNWARATTSI